MAPLPPCPTPFSDHTFAVKHGVSVDLRVFPAEVSSPAPFVLYIHGGAFCAGKHYYPNPWVVPGYRARGIHVVSMAYRFAPQCSLDDMVEDGEDAYNWCRTKLASVLGESKLDIDRCILIGESAGGTIATLLAHRLEPAPRVLVDVYGVVDFTAPRWEPGAPRNAVEIQPLTGPWSEEEVKAGVEAQDPSKTIITCPFEFETPQEDVAKLWAVPEYKYDDTQVFQYEMKKYLRTTNLLVPVILRQNGKSGVEWAEVKRAHSSLLLLDEKKTYPPTYFLHGDADMAVPITDAYKMASKLKEMGVPVGESYEPGMGHEFDHKYHGTHTEGWDKYIEPCLAFTEKYAKQ